MKKGKMTRFFEEFKEFAINGNALQLAVGVIIGGAFNAIVASLVNDIIGPFISLLTGSANFSQLEIIIRPETERAAQVILPYGNFIQAVINFVITAFCIFVMVKAINKVHKKKPEPVEEAPAKAEDIVILENILLELKRK